MSHAVAFGSTVAPTSRPVSRPNSRPASRNVSAHATPTRTAPPPTSPAVPPPPPAAVPAPAALVAGEPPRSAARALQLVPPAAEVAVDPYAINQTQEDWRDFEFRRHQDALDLAYTPPPVASLPLPADPGDPGLSQATDMDEYEEEQGRPPSPRLASHPPPGDFAFVLQRPSQVVAPAVGLAPAAQPPLSDSSGDSRGPDGRPLGPWSGDYQLVGGNTTSGSDDAAVGPSAAVRASGAPLMDDGHQQPRRDADSLPSFADLTLGEADVGECCGSPPCPSPFSPLPLTSLPIPAPCRCKWWHRHQLVRAATWCAPFTWLLGQPPCCASCCYRSQSDAHSQWGPPPCRVQCWPTHWQAANHGAPTT